MASKSNGDNTYNFINGEVLQDEDLNKTFEHMSPIGSVIAWLKNLTNTPALPSTWVECNGQVLSDAESVYNGVTIPDLNGNNRFLRGNSTSGGTGGAETHDLSHNHPLSTNSNLGGGSGSYRLTAPSTGNSLSTIDNKPPYYSVVWIMRIK